MSVTSPSRHRRVRPLRAAAAGAAVFGGLCVIFWATAAAGMLPLSTPEWLRTITPAAGLTRLVLGLAFMGLAGATVSLLFASAYNLTQRQT